MNINTPKPNLFQHAYISAILPGECFRSEDSSEVYIMTNYDEVYDRYIVVNLSTGLRVEFTPSEADAMSVIRMRVDATAVPYLYITKE